MNAWLDDTVQLPTGLMVRIRPLQPCDAAGVQRLLGSPDAIRWTSAPDGAHTAGAELVADVPWGGHIVGHAACRRAPGPRGHAAVAVAREYGRAGLAVQLLARLARVADAAMIPTLVVATGADAELAPFATEGFGAETVDPAGKVELATREWPRALAVARRFAAGRRGAVIA